MPVRELKKQDVSEKKLWYGYNRASANPMELKTSSRSEPQVEAKRYEGLASCMYKSLDVVSQRRERTLDKAFYFEGISWKGTQL